MILVWNLLLWCVLYPLAGGARGRLGNGHALVGKARIVVLDDMDDAAPREAGLRQEILHHRVVGVRVDAEMPALRERPFDAGASNAPVFPARIITKGVTANATINAINNAQTKSGILNSPLSQNHTDFTSL